MKWQEIIIKPLKFETDELGNMVPYTDESDERIILGRLTQWTSEDITMYGRELTESSRKLITPSKDISQHMILTVGEVDYEIQEIQDLGRFRFVILKELAIWQK